MSHEPRYGRTKVRQSVRQLANVRRIDCPSGKATYENKQTARSEGARISKWRVAQGMASVTPYRCRHCDRWHLTSKARS